MAGPFDLITGALGQTNPYDEARAYQQRQNAQNNAALGLGPDGSPLPASGAPGPNGAAPGPDGSPAVSPGATGAKGPTPAQTQSPGATPDAVKTPEDLGSIMLDLQQYNERNQGFNQALGAGFAAFAQPRDRPMVSQMFNVNQSDPTKIGQMLMNMNSQQQGQNRANAVMRMVNDQNQGPMIAQAFGMSWPALKAGVLSDPGLVAKIAETWGTADEKVRAGAQVGHGALGGAVPGAPGAPGGPGAPGAPNPIADVGKQIVAGVGGQDNQAMNEAQMAWDAKNPGQPTPWGRNDLESFKRYTQDQNERQTSAQDFGKLHGQSIDKVTEFQHRVEALKTDPGMNEIMANPNVYRQAMKWIMQHKDDTAEQAAAAAPDWAASIAGYTPQVKNALTELQLLRSRDYANAMHSIGQRFSTQEVQNVSKGMDSLLNLELSKDDYNNGLDNLIDETKTIRANSHGAAQDFDTMDPDLRTYVNPTFTKGGRRNVAGSGSEDWADAVKPPQSEIDGAKAALAKGVPRTQVDARVRAHGFRPMGY